MKKICYLVAVLYLGITMTSCVSKGKFRDLEADMAMTSEKLEKTEKVLESTELMVDNCKEEKLKLEGELKSARDVAAVKDDQMNDLRDQLADMRKQRDMRLEQMGDLAVLSKSANENINKTLEQLAQRDQYIEMLRSAKNKTDSVNLALAVNLKGALSEGIADKDIDVAIDKTVVYINLSDKMLYRSGSHKLNSGAKDILAKIAKIIEDRPEYEVIVEGYTDSRSISNDCISDNWDLSVKRATSVVRSLQDDYKIDPNRLIAAGRGETNAIASNETSEGRSLNRRTRIIILPKLDQFYDLLNPDLASKN
jgi:chemotaxis protein MotB